MTSIRVTITRNEEISPEAVARVASEFMEWLERIGVEFTFPAVHVDTAYEDLAEMYAAYVRIERGGHIR